jgi:hypothetical protein
VPGDARTEPRARSNTLHLKRDSCGNVRAHGDEMADGMRIFVRRLNGQTEPITAGFVSPSSSLALFRVCVVVVVVVVVGIPDSALARANTTIAEIQEQVEGASLIFNGRVLQPHSTVRDLGLVKSSVLYAVTPKRRVCVSVGLLSLSHVCLHLCAR